MQKYFNDEILQTHFYLEFPKKLREVKMPNLSIIKGGDIYATKKEGFPLNTEKVKTIQMYLEKIKLETLVSETEFSEEEFNAYFGNTKVVNLQGETKLDIEIGQLNNFTGKFGLKVNEKYYLALDTNPAPRIYKSDEERAIAKYNVLLQVLSIKKLNLIETKVLSSLAEENIYKINFKDFALNYTSKETKPLPPKGVESSLQNIQSFFMSMKSLKIFQIYPRGKKIGKVINKVEFKGLNLKHLKVSLFQQYGTENGYFIFTNQHQFIYKLTSGEFTKFKSNIQSFWDLKLPFDGATLSVIQRIYVEDKQADVFFNNENISAEFLSSFQGLLLGRYPVVKVDPVKNEKLKALFSFTFKELAYDVSKNSNNELVLFSRKSEISYYFGKKLKLNSIWK